MTWLNSELRWGWLAQLLHWLVFVLIVAAWFTFELHEDAPRGSPERAAWLDYHRAVGLTIFFAVWPRLGLRFISPAPRGLSQARWQDHLAGAVHWALYGLMILLPVRGVLTTQLAGRQVSWFGLFTLPAFVSPSKSWAELFQEIHTEVLWPLLLVLVGLHISGALYHHFIARDATLRRMLP